jgi:hypothetical protein
LTIDFHILLIFADVIERKLEGYSLVMK